MIYHCVFILFLLLGTEKERHQARRGNDWLQEALGLGDRKIVKIATQTVLEEEEAKSRFYF